MMTSGDHADRGANNAAASFVELVRSAAPIVEVAWKLVDLSDTSRPTGLCPFHKDSSPSFSVWPEEGRWKCFGCGRGGSVFDLVMEAEKTDFWGAVLILADRYGIAVPEFKPKDRVKTDAEQAVRSLLAKYVSASHKALLKNEKALEYLHGRGITDESIEEYQLGVGIGITEPVRRAQATAAGLIVKKGDREYELMRGRLVFPVTHHGTIVNICGRTLREETPKYLSLANPNPGLTPIVPMGIHRLRGKQCVLVEGVIDMILLKQAGIAACASISDKFSSDWLRWCGKNTCFLLCYDSDANQAGQNANLKVGGMLFESGFAVEIVELPIGHDPASYLQQNGGEAFESLMAQALPYISYWLRRQPDRPTADAQNRILRAFYPLVAHLDRGIRGRFIKEFAERYELTQSDVREGLKEFLRGQGRAEKQPAIDGTEPGEDRDYQYPDPNDPRPVVYTDDEELSRVTDALWEAVRQANDPPRLFRQGGWPIRLRPDDNGTLRTQPFTLDIARHALSRAISFRKKIKKGNSDFEVLSVIPDVKLKDFLAVPDVPLPVLDRIVEVPVFGMDGSLQTSAGYHAASQTYYKPVVGLEIAEISESPSDEEVKRAVETFRDLVCDFPFETPADLCHAFCLWLLPYVRSIIKGPTPMHLIEAPQAGSGKSLLMDLLLSPSLGVNVGSITQPTEEEEWKKLLTSIFVEGHPAVLIDNVNTMLNSGVLSSALVQPVWTGRILGRTGTAEVPIKLIWVMTANNPKMTTEMTRRCIRIRINPQMMRPWLRENDMAWRHPNIQLYVRENRGLMVWAALTIVRAWVARGMPRHPGKILGSFEQWSLILGGVCDVADMKGFLGNLMELYEGADEEGEQWEIFIRAWWETHGGIETSSKELAEIARELDCFAMGTSKAGAAGDSRSLGRKLNKNIDVVVAIGLGQFRVQRGKQKSRAYQYYLERIGEAPAGVEDGDPGAVFAPDLPVMEDEDPFGEEE